MTRSIRFPGPSRSTTPECKAAGFSIVVAEWPRNSGELVRIALDQFGNCFTVDARSWWRGADGIFKPSRSGLTLAVTHLPKLAAGLDKALQRAEMLGLVEPVAKIKDRTTAQRQRRYRQPRNDNVTE